jgi:hypothetical protein
MDNLRAIELINEIERIFPVDQWKIQGVHYWPLIRISLAWSLRNAQPSDTSSLPALLQFRKVAHAIGSFIRFAYARFVDRKQNAVPTHAVDAVLLGDGISRVLLMDSWYDKLCDPFVDALASREMSCFHLEPNDYYIVPRHRPSMFIAPTLYRIKAKAVLSGNARDVRIENDTKYDQFLVFLRNKEIAHDPYTLPALSKKIVTLLEMSDHFRDLMGILKPQIGFVVDYPALEGMAFCHACRTMGIPSIVIQHGVQSDIHAAYARWTQVPAAGYNVLPSIFWCWSEDDAAVISDWNKNTSPLHHAIAGGNLFLQKWMDSTSPLVMYYDRLIADLKESHRGSLHVLATLQYSYCDEDHLKTLLQTMRGSPSDWRWWVRLHPMMKDDAGRIRALFDQYRIKNYEMDRATELPLYAVLRNIDVHVTLHSAVVIEAESFDVPSVIIDEKGSAHFQNQITSGTAVAAYDPDSIIDAISQQTIIKRQRSRRSLTAPMHAQDKIDELLAVADNVRNRLTLVH